jgi:hypothetical protein
MPITHSIEPTGPRVCTRAAGIVTYEELNKHLEDEVRDHALEMGELLDARDATTDITGREVRLLAYRTERLARTDQFGPLAIVATSEVAYGMARMYQTLCDALPVHIGVFRDIGEAREWLDALARVHEAARGVARGPAHGAVHGAAHGAGERLGMSGAP